MTHEYVSLSGGISYDLEYPYRYKEDGESWVVFSPLDGWVWRRFRFADERGENNWQRRFFSEKRAQQFCRAVNGLGDYHDPAINAMHDMEA